MTHQTIELSCPGCGARVTTSQSECMYCYNPIIISTFNSVYSMPMPEVNKCASVYRKALVENPDNHELNTSLAMCYLKLKLYDQASLAFEKAVEDNFDNSEVFFYAAICLMKGQKAFLAPRQNIDKSIEYVNAAIMIEPKGIYYYFLSYIKYDYFNRKYLNTTPTYQEVRQTAVNTGVSDFDIEQLFLVLNVQKPECM